MKHDAAGIYFIGFVVDGKLFMNKYVYLAAKIMIWRYIANIQQFVLDKYPDFIKCAPHIHLNHSYWFENNVS